MCQILKLPLFLSYFSLPYLIYVTEEAGIFSVHRLFREIPKRLSKKELGVQTVWQRMKEAKSQCQHVQTLEDQVTANIPFSQIIPCNSQSTQVSAPCSVLLISSCVMNDD